MAFGLCDTGGDVMKETLKPSDAWTDVPPSDMVWCIRNMIHDDDITLYNQGIWGYYGVLYFQAKPHSPCSKPIFQGSMPARRGVT